MKEGEIYLMDLDFEYKMWKNHIDWFLRDLSIIRSRNEEIANGKGKKELNAVEEMVIDDYEDQLKRMLKRIKTQEQEMQYYNKDFPVTPRHQYVIEHLELRRRMEQVTNDVIAKISDLIKELSI
ncbi:hypothetical protein [Anaerophaga thermohalophila]|jgi:uncharacterized membrane protein YgaE (UPF0421/DUF939 family)|uniref:hypothetical protein n=1 Tax=Anaerophaga thermohalophila TaxID=177400 RepID=UPI00031A8ED2|nr:hypothetical protein [Anaerophaga thermohalophila]